MTSDACNSSMNKQGAFDCLPKDDKLLKLFYKDNLTFGTL
jgi:hypothetical protein